MVFDPEEAAVAAIESATDSKGRPSHRSNATRIFGPAEQFLIDAQLEAVVSHQAPIDKDGEAAIAKLNRGYQRDE